MKGRTEAEEMMMVMIKDATGKKRLARKLARRVEKIGRRKIS